MEAIDAPAPMSPPDCDLRGYKFMPLFGTHVFGSEFYDLALDNPRAGLAAIKLWWVAYASQCPAGSLPDNDRILARFADFGSDLRGWRKVKEIALHGFVLCSDGRLYHPLLCKEAIKAQRELRADRERKRAKKAASQASQVIEISGNGAEISAGMPPEIRERSGGYST